MKHEENTSKYESDEGKMLVRKSDNAIIGYGIDLGIEDSIENYEEREFTAEEIAAFWKSIGMEDPRKPKEKLQHKLFQSRTTFSLKAKTESKTTKKGKKE